jgi:hypothetical protein
MAKDTQFLGNQAQGVCSWFLLRTSPSWTPCSLSRRVHQGVLSTRLYRLNQPMSREKSSRFSPLQQKCLRIFYQLLRPYKKLHGFHTIDDTMIIRERHVHHGANYYLTVDDDRTLLNLMHT